jgi:hypothetical protein
VLSLAASVAILKREKLGNMINVVADVTFDASYPTGGEALTAQQFGLSVLNFVLPSPAAGYVFEFDHANKKIKAFTPVKVQAAHTHAVALDGGASAAGSSHNHVFTGTDAGLTLVTAETLTVTTDVGTLAFPPAAILAIHGTVSAASSVFTVVPNARTLATLECKVNYTTGAITFYASDDPTSVTVDYLKKAAVPTGTNAAETTHTHASGSLVDAASGTGGAITAAAAAEVASTTDLSTLVVRVLVIGY